MMTHHMASQAEAGAATQSLRRHTDGSAFLTPSQLAARWAWHEESVRRAIRQRRLGSVVVGRRRLVPIEEIEQVEREGFIARAA